MRRGGAPQLALGCPLVELSSPRVVAALPPPLEGPIRDQLILKYDELLALRRERAEVEARGLWCFPEGEGVDRKARFRSLARKFPGALRELDTSTVQRLEERLTLLQTWQGQEPLALWPIVTFDYHRSLRVLLRLKAWLGPQVARGSRVVPEAALDAFSRRWRRLHGVGGSMAEMDWRPVLQRVLRPPEGRLQHLVWEALESRHGIERSHLEQLVFG